jgi:hypothetical protein
MTLVRDHGGMDTTSTLTLDLMRRTVDGLH